MTLKEALKTLIDAKGLEIHKTPLSLNILSDFNAFEEIPSSKNVLKYCISEGYLEKIAFLYDNGLPIGDVPNSYAKELYHKIGFRADVSNYVINAILGSLGFPETVYTAFIEETSGNINVGATTQPVPNEDNHFKFKGIPINGSKDNNII